MEADKVDATVSESKEESIRKAIELLQGVKVDQPSVSRPAISTSRTLAVLAIWLISCVLAGAGIVFLGRYLAVPMWAVWLAVTALVVGVLVWKAKSMIRNAVLLYQKHAPEKLRRSCLYTPTCSAYMLLSVEKYGVIKGCSKGIGRLCRCRYPNGGEDYP